jgi:histidinol-phosphate aminotransferase
VSFEQLANPWVGGLPIYEPGRPIDEVARELGFADPSEIDKLASNENSLGPSPTAVEAMRSSAVDMHRYPDGGAFHLKRALAEHLAVSPETILPGNGSNELIELLGHSFLNPGAGIVMADRAFVVYRLVAALFNAPVVTVPMRDWTHDLPAMADAVTSSTRLVFVSNPNNPTGTMVGGEALDALLDRLPDHAILCVDEAYVELLPQEKQPDTLRYVREGRRVVVLRTFSKAYGLAGLRLGYALAPPECIRLMNRTRQPFNVNAMALAGACAALEDNGHVARTRELVERGRVYIEDACRSLGLPTVPSVTNFMLIEVEAGRQVCEALQREGVIVRPMDGYGLPSHVRVTVGTDAENARFVAALRRVLKR